VLANNLLAHTESADSHRVLNRVVRAAIGGVVGEEPAIIKLNAGELNASLAY
jgi:hypothetical protein